MNPCKHALFIAFLMLFHLTCHQIVGRIFLNPTTSNPWTLNPDFPNPTQNDYKTLIMPSTSKGFYAMAIMPPRQLHTIVPGSCSPGPLDSKVGTGPLLGGSGGLRNSVNNGHVWGYYMDYRVY